MTKVLQNITSDLEATQELYVAFFIKGNNLLPEDVTKWLNIKPTYTYTKGDLIVPRGPRKKDSYEQASKRPISLWAVSTKENVVSVRIEDHFKYLLALLEPGKEKIQNYLDNPSEYQVSVRVWREALGYAGVVDMESLYLVRICHLCHIFTFHYVTEEEEE